MVRHLIKKNGRSIRPRNHFNLSCSPYVSLKEIKIAYPIRCSDFLFTGSWGGAFQVKKNWSRPIRSCLAELLVHPPHSIDYFSLLGPSRAYVTYGINYINFTLSMDLTELIPFQGQNITCRTLLRSNLLSIKKFSVRGERFNSIGINHCIRYILTHFMIN